MLFRSLSCGYGSRAPGGGDETTNPGDTQVNKIILGAIAIASLSLGACATVTRGTNTAWEVQTDPDGARVETSNGHMCPATPCSIKMPRKSEFTATVTKPGYKPATVTVTHKTSGAGAAGVAGNVLVGGLIGIGVDAVSGASQDLVPNPAHEIGRAHV